MPLRIEDYALIGDCETTALVGRDGSVDWLCWPRFDSGACFAALLGGPEQGRWLIAPAEPAARISRRYRDDTLILETDFETTEGAVTLIDFMPLRGHASDLIRLVVGKRGRVQMRTELVIRFDYGSVVPWVTRVDEETMRAIAGPDMVVLRTKVPLRGEDMRTVGEFTVAEGETAEFALTYQHSHYPVPKPVRPQAELRYTEKFWHEWAGRGTECGRWSGAVRRSLITLKAMTYRPTGGLVAAPTTSLPEQLGGPRNWDYRYCWIRDATLTLLALMNSGYYDEAREWRAWLVRAVAGSPAQLQIMYGLAGERRLAEWEIPWLPGYEGSKPVRIGNAAHEQLQLDVYGEVMDAFYQARRGGLGAVEGGPEMARAFLEHLEQIWRQPDEGIWEVRGGPRQFTFSKVMAWVAFDRAIRLVEMLKSEAPVDRWREVRDAIHKDVCENGYDADLGSFVQSYGSKQLDASLLQIPCLGFLPPEDKRVRGTVMAVERNLVEDGLVKRYHTGKSKDGLPPGEGAFLACSFWLADAYVMVGRHDDAVELFERLLALRNDVGLLSEEYDVKAGRQVGNFPQAFSHLALVNTAHNLTLTEKPSKQRAHG